MSKSKRESNPSPSRAEPGTGSERTATIDMSQDTGDADGTLLVPIANEETAD